MDVQVVERAGIVQVLSDYGVVFEQELPTFDLEVTCVVKFRVPENKVPTAVGAGLLDVFPEGTADSYAICELEVTAEIKTTTTCTYGCTEYDVEELVADIEYALEKAGYEVVYVDTNTSIGEYYVTPAVLLYDALQEFSSFAVLYRDDDGRRIVGFGPHDASGRIDVCTEVKID